MFYCSEFGFLLNNYTKLVVITRTKASIERFLTPSINEIDKLHGNT